MISATHATGRAAINDATRRRMQRHCRPIPKLAMSQWSGRYRVINGAPWLNDTAPYLVPIMDALSDRTTQEVVFIAPSQSGKTEIALNAIGYFSHQEPSPILVVQPTVEMGESFSKERISGMLRDTLVLGRLFGEAKSRDSSNTILSKQCPGGGVDIAGANAPAGLAMRPKRVVILDERDRHPTSAGAEGDVKAISRARTRRWRKRRKIYEVSSPTDEETSLIWPSFLEGTQQHVQLVCPLCDFAQIPQFERLKYETTESGQVDPASVRYECASCEKSIPQSRQTEVKRRLSLSPPLPAKVPHKQSFRLHGLMAAFHDWVEIAQEFVTANGQKDPSMRANMLRAFFNTTLGELYRDTVMETVKSTLIARAKRYDGGEKGDAVTWHVPREAGILVAGWDIQHDRGEGVIRAVGVGAESWLVERVILRGDTSQPAFWAQLEEYRTRRTWLHESGMPMRVRAMAVDAGDGSRSKEVYTYCAPRLGEGVFAIKGHNQITAPMIPNKPTKVKPGRVYVIGVNAIMETLYRRLGMETRGPGYLHFNEFAGETPPHGVPDDYFTQLLSMKRERDEKTRRYRWVATKNVRNEVADCETYAYAAFLLGPVPLSLMAAEVTRLNEEGEKMKSGAKEEAEPVQPQQQTQSWLGASRSGWMRRVRG